MLAAIPALFLLIGSGFVLFGLHGLRSSGSRQPAAADAAPGRATPFYVIAVMFGGFLAGVGLLTLLVGAIIALH